MKNNQNIGGGEKGFRESVTIETELLDMRRGSMGVTIGWAQAYNELNSEELVNSIRVNSDSGLLMVSLEFKIPPGDAVWQGKGALTLRTISKTKEKNS